MHFHFLEEFVFSRDDLAELLNRLKGKYYILEINGKRVFQYVTEYLDTPAFAMYLKHHNKGLNRYKIRVRTYIETKQKYLEIKFKDNKGKTRKRRIKITDDDIHSPAFSRFIEDGTPFNTNQLNRVFINSFSRITFVDAQFTERLTIDTDLTFKRNGKETHFDNIAIAEIKNERKYRNSNFAEIAKGLGIYPQSFSKYTIGCILNYPELKSNRFKKKLNVLNKLNDRNYV